MTGEWEDAPSWVHDAAKRERWQADQWSQWENLRECFNRFKVRLEPTIVDGERLTLIQAIGPVPFTAARPTDTEERPVFEALHRLCNQLAADEIEQRDARVAEANRLLRDRRYSEEELRVTASVFGDDVVWFEGTLADPKPEQRLTSGEMLQAIDQVDPKTAS